ncbi:LCCL domain-containing protein [Hepatocystis sp. ex Piliocolobus tephrosceles]|nr:LCCL domain-containing protein [Hepatocystis sp. ex Piliocolobus tephrosceles]
MRYVFFFLWCAILNNFVRCQESATNFYKFIDSIASSTYISEESGSTEYDAKRAIQNNPSYWCSSGNHIKDEEITWTGYLNTKGFINGVKISWEYSPEFVSISVSSDGENYNNVIPYKRISDNQASFDEIYFFKKLEEVISVRIGLKNAIHKYFGIREVRVLGAGNPYFLLLSGITSEDEMCLQVEEGLINNDNTPVILDSCINALASGDGRELWKSNSNNQIISAFSDPPKCLSVINLDDLEKNKLILYDCLTALEDGDGKSNWVFESNSQIRLQRSGEPLCISQKNIYSNKPGISDILLNMDVSVEASSLLDDDHNAENTIDNNLNSFWASTTFSNNYEHLVNFLVDLNTLVDISRIKIYWEYPPLHYSINVSSDGHNFKNVIENLANPSFITLDTLKNIETRFIKISMIKTHPIHGEMGDQFLYGIRSIEVQANNLETVLNFCRDAANSDDSRDKYFIEYITEFNEELTNKLINMEEDVSKSVNSISNNLTKLEELLPNIENCLEEKKSYDEKLTISNEKANTLNDKLSSIVSIDLMHDKDLIRLGMVPGDSFSYPANDCSVIKNLEEIPQSGFYWIKPKCAPEVLRVYCDMESSTSIYILNKKMANQVDSGGGSTDSVNPKIVNSVDDIKRYCAEVGLEPLILKSESQLNSLIVSLKRMGYTLNGKINIPLAYDYSCDHDNCSGKFHDLLNGNIDLSSIIYSRTSESPDSSKNRQTAGISYDDGSFKFFNLKTSDISSIVCSTNLTENDATLQYLSINCETTAMESDFNAILNTNVVVFCPIGCDSEKYEHVPVYGSKGVYSDNSSICRAAIHSGVITNKGGLVNVTIETELDHYEGTTSNNIESISLDKDASQLHDIIISGEKENVKQKSTLFYHRSIRIGNLTKDCPLDLYQYKQTAFLEKRNMTTSTMSSSKELKYNAENEVGGEEDSNIEGAKFHEIIDELFNTIDSIHGVDSSVISIVQNETTRVIEKTKKELKPADILSKKQVEGTMNLYTLTENLALYLYDLSSKYMYDLDKLKERLEELKRVQKVTHNFGTVKLNYKTMNFSSLFHIFDSKIIKNNPSKWGYVDTEILGHKNSIGQLSSISNTEISEGYYATLKGLNFYDFEINVSILSKGTGCFGIVFRAKDDFNFYLFDVCDKEGLKRLSKVENGEVTILKQYEENVYTNNKWDKYQIVTKHANIDIYELDDIGNKVKILSSIDERFLSGTVGLYSQIYGQGTFFDDLEIIPLPCTQISENANNQKYINMLHCSYYKEKYEPSMFSYTIIKDGDYKWGFVKNVDEYGVVDKSDNEKRDYEKRDYEKRDYEKRDYEETDYDRKDYLLCSKLVNKDNNSTNNVNDETYTTIAILKQRKCVTGYLSFVMMFSNNNNNDNYINILFHYEDELNFSGLEITNTTVRFIARKNNELTTLSESIDKDKIANILEPNKWIHINVHFDKLKMGVSISNASHNSPNEVVEEFELSAENVDLDMIHPGSVGFMIHNYNEVKFGSILLSSNVSDTNASFIHVASKEWSTCAKSVHVLNRRASCETILHPNEPKEKHINCIKNFCEECCLHHTEMLDSNEKKNCEKHCKKNDSLATKMQTLFEKFIDKCVSMEVNKEYQKCDKEDSNCRNKVCVLCCKKNDISSHDELKKLPIQQSKEIQEKEIIECQFQCNLEHVVVE